MSLRRTRVVISLEGVPPLPDIEAAAGDRVERPTTPLETAREIALGGPSLVVIHGDSAWQRELVASIPADRRPPVLVYGGADPAALSIADEWIATAPMEAPEARARACLAQERGRARRVMARRGFVDLLTGLPNRRAVIRAMFREAARARRNGSELGLVLMDLEDFDRVNKMYGHLGGDRVLRAAGALLRRGTRSTDMCGRIEGDEFALIVTGGLSSAMAASARMAQGLLRLSLGVTTAASVLRPRESLRSLYRRTAELLRRKQRERPRRRSGELPSPTLHAVAAILAERDRPRTPPPIPAPDASGDVLG